MNMEITEKTESNETKINLNAKYMFYFKNILDISISRGTWKGNELTQIGDIYNLLNNVITQIQQKINTEVNPEVTKEIVQEALNNETINETKNETNA
jgi:hypothetical protein